ncbi:MAG: deoxyribonuclease [Thermoprotei archaeon]|nr:MAG: deoxyribonuclease [Thermoprotei archaeon]
MLRVGDNHCHLNPVRGMGVKAFARKFKDSGGWFLGLVNLTSWSYGVEVSEASDYERVYRVMLRVARELREEGLKVAIILGPHPAELVRLIERGVRMSKAVGLIVDAYRIAARYVKLGEAHGLGEVGRPHWRVSTAVIEACNEVLNHVIEMALELDCVVHLHVERRGLETIADLATRVRGLKRVVLHHAEGAYSREAFERGLIPSVPAKESELIAALKGGRHFVVESDFLDDPRRPGAVVAPWSIARLFRRLMRKGLLSEEDARVILIENIERLYGERLA